MAQKAKTREITIVEEGGTFSTFFKRFASEQKEFDFEGLSALRQLLSNEKARMLHTKKRKIPTQFTTYPSFWVGILSL
jgi:hypothetical protein